MTVKWHREADEEQPGDGDGWEQHFSRLDSGPQGRLRGGLCQEISWKNLNRSVHPSGCQRVTSPHATQPPEYSTVLF